MPEDNRENVGQANVSGSRLRRRWRHVPAVMLLSPLLAFVQAWEMPSASADVRIMHQKGRFPVRGETPRAVVRDLLRHGPLVEGRHAFARTRMKATMKATFARQGTNCQVRRLDIRVSFTTLLPRALSYRRFSPSLRREWRSFIRELARHEDTHQRIWRMCLHHADVRLKRLHASDCTALNGRVKAAFRTILKRCDARHEAFDRRERRRTPRLPFVRRALTRHVSRAD